MATPECSVAVMVYQMFVKPPNQRRFVVFVTPVELPVSEDTIKLVLAGNGSEDGKVVL